MQRYLQASILVMTNTGFSRPAMAASYFPAGAQNDHVHLGAPTAVDGRVAEGGNVFVTFISIKRNDRFAGRLQILPNGYFDRHSLPPGTLTPAWEAALDALGILS